MEREHLGQDSCSTRKEKEFDRFREVQSHAAAQAGRSKTFHSTLIDKSLLVIPKGFVCIKFYYGQMLTSFLLGPFPNKESSSSSAQGSMTNRIEATGSLRAALCHD